MGRRLTTADFVEQARAVHGHRYDYTLSDYVQRTTLIEVICLEHGVFSILLWRHVRSGEGCPECAKVAAQERQREAAQQWVTRAREVHGDRYDYTQVDYRGTAHTVTIGCPAHGPFQQNASSHLQGRGCRDCGRLTASAKLKDRSRGYSTEEWVEKAIEVHGDRYGYGQVIYRGASAKVIVLCPTHGSFEQTAGQHLVGYGCVACATTSKLTQEEFLQRAHATHGDRYDYSETAFVDIHHKVQIRCQAHGSFDQFPKDHWNGSNCPACAIEQRRQEREAFIAHAKEIHGDRYDYSSTVYVSSRTRIRIDCRVHGAFIQRPMNHLQGHGCPQCGRPRK